MKKRVALLTALYAAGLGVALAACSKNPAGQDAPVPAIAIDLIMPASSPEDPCDNLEKLQALVRAADGGAYIGCGPLPRYAIREVLKSSQAQFLACLGHARDKGAEKTVKLHWTVQADGTVEQVEVPSAPEGEDGLRQCLAAAVQNLKFPEPMGGGVVEINWPFRFAPRSD